MTKIYEASINLQVAFFEAHHITKKLRLPATEFEIFKNKFLKRAKALYSHTNHASIWNGLNSFIYIYRHMVDEQVEEIKNIYPGFIEDLFQKLTIFNSIIDDAEKKQGELAFVQIETYAKAVSDSYQISFAGTTETQTKAIYALLDQHGIKPEPRMA